MAVALFLRRCDSVDMTCQDGTDRNLSPIAKRSCRSSPGGEWIASLGLLRVDGFLDVRHDIDHHDDVVLVVSWCSLVSPESFGSYERDCGESNGESQDGSFVEHGDKLPLF